MPQVEARARIAAPPEAVWAVLTDAARLRGGGFGILALDGRIAPGERLRLRSEADPRRTFALRVAAFEPPRRMVWTGGMPFGLFRGTRTFALAPVAGGTEVRLTESFTGPLSGLIARSIPDLRPSFETFLDGLAAHATRRAA